MRRPRHLLLHLHLDKGGRLEVPAAAGSMDASVDGVITAHATYTYICTSTKVAA